VDNNRARTVLNLFLNQVLSHGIPRRVRGDHGTENLEVAAWMEERFGVERGSYIWGRSDRIHLWIHSVPNLYLAADLIYTYIM
jgi:hypothetical protein